VLCKSLIGEICPDNKVLLLYINKNDDYRTEKPNGYHDPVFSLGHNLHCVPLKSGHKEVKSVENHIMDHMPSQIQLPF
jgi:hypothetical protein